MGFELQSIRPTAEDVPTIAFVELGPFGAIFSGFLGSDPVPDP
jgi:hypothetical protein